MQWLIPSIADLIFIALLSLLAYSALSVRLLGDAGIGWHIRTGQLILETHSVPRVDPFSSTMSGQPWFAWEWLYDVVVGQIDKVAGLNGVVFLTAVVIAFTFSWTFRLLLRRGTNFLVALSLVLLAVSSAMIHFLARPHVVSWLFTLICFQIVDSCEGESSETATRRKYSLWLLPLLIIVWVNVHGGFLIAFALLGIYWLSAVWEYFHLKEGRFEDALEKIRAGKRARDLALVSVFSAAATFINPYGWKLHLHIYRYLSNRFLMDHIDEFQSPNFHGVAQKCFAVLLLLTLVELGLRGRSSGRAREMLLILFAVYSGLYASRNIPISALLIILVIGPRLSTTLRSLPPKLINRRDDHPKPTFFHRMQTIESSQHGHLWPLAALVLTAWITFHAGRLDSHELMSAHFDAKRFPDAAVSYLQQHNLQGPIFAPDYWGGYLIYRLYPRTKVVIDDRHDLFGERLLRSYLKTLHLEPDWEDFLREHDFNCVVVPKNSALANILRETEGWEAMYTDDAAVILIRVTERK